MSDLTFTRGITMGVVSKTLIITRALSLLDRFIFAALLSLIILVAIPFGTVEPWWISLYECAVFGLGALWMLEGLVSGSWDVKEIGLILSIMALALFVFLQSLTLPVLAGTISADPFETRLVFLKLLGFAMNGALLLRYLSSGRRLRSLIHVVIGVAVASAVFGIARQALQHNEAGFILPYLHRDSGFGQFVNKNHFAFLMEMAIGLATGFMLAGAVRRKHLLFYFSAVALMWIGLVLTNSRGGLFSMLSQIAFMIAIFVWMRSKSSGRSQLPKKFPAFRLFALAAALSICLLGVVGLGAIWVGGDVMATRLASLPAEINTESREPQTGVRRREVWGATWQLINAHPLTGSGFGAYGVAITKFHHGSGKFVPEAAHNDYLELLASGGLLGAGFLVWFGLSFIKRARCQLSSVDPLRRAACLGALTGIFGVMAHNFVDFGLHVTANGVMFITLVVIAVRDFSEPNQSEQL
jgi:O-antigen ligase